MKRKERMGKKGFTLIEMILAVAIAGIFFTVAAMVLPQWIRTYQSAIKLNNANQIVNNIINGVRDEIAYSFDVTKDDDIISYKRDKLAPASMIQLKTANPMIPGLVYEEQTDSNTGSNFYMGFEVMLDAKIQDVDDAKQICILTVSISDNGETILERSRNIRLYGLIS